MKNNREVKTDLAYILSLIHCAEDYGFGRDIFWCCMARITGPVTDEEIKAFADDYLTPESRAMGYGEEDQESAVERITRWRNKYAKEI